MATCQQRRALPKLATAMFHSQASTPALKQMAFEIELVEVSKRARHNCNLLENADHAAEPLRGQHVWVGGLCARAFACQHERVT